MVKSTKLKLMSLVVLIPVFFMLICISPAFAKTKVVRWSYPSLKKGAAAVWVPFVIDEVKKRTEGRVEFQVYWGGTLCKLPEMATAVKTGVADIGWISHNYHPGFGELVGVGEAGSLFAPNITPAKYMENIHKLNEMTSAITDELKQKGMIPIINVYYDYWWIFSNKPIRNLADFKGIKLKASINFQQVALRAVGAAPIQLSAHETYSSLQKGIIDAVCFSPEVADRYRVQEVCKYVAMVNFSPGIAQFCMNLKTFQSLGKKDQQIILQIGKEAAIMLANYLLDVREKMKIKFKQASMELIEFPQKDRDTWTKMPEIQKITSNWVTEMEKNGLPARKTLDIFLQLMK